MWTWLVIACGVFLLLAWVKQVSSYVLGFSLTDQEVWRRLWRLVRFKALTLLRRKKPTQIIHRRGAKGTSATAAGKK
jgi:hypothetical protein